MTSVETGPRAGWPLTTSTLRGRSWDIFLTVRGQIVARDARTGTLTTIARYDGTGNRLSSLIGEWAVDILSLQQKMLAPPSEDEGPTLIEPLNTLHASGDPQAAIRAAIEVSMREQHLSDDEPVADPVWLEGPQKGEPAMPGPEAIALMQQHMRGTLLGADDARSEAIRATGVNPDANLALRLSLACVLLCWSSWLYSPLVMACIYFGVQGLRTAHEANGLGRARAVLALGLTAISLPLGISLQLFSAILWPL